MGSVRYFHLSHSTHDSEINKAVGRNQIPSIELIEMNKRLFAGAESQPSVFLEDPLPLLVHPITPPPNLTPHLSIILPPDVHSQGIWNSLCVNHPLGAGRM
jgi:hypothetical protein